MKIRAKMELSALVLMRVEGETTTCVFVQRAGKAATVQIEVQYLCFYFRV